MTEQQIDQQEAELDSWMTRAYEAEKRAWQAEKRIKAVEDSLDTYAYTGICTGQERVAVSDIRRALESVPCPGSSHTSATNCAPPGRSSSRPDMMKPPPAEGAP